VAFLDRDGTINAKPPGDGYVVTPEELRLLPQVGEAIRRLNDAGIKVLVITNQRGIARGKLTVRTLNKIHSRLSELIDLEAGAHVDDFFYCPHEIGTCSCRKPGIGMFLQAEQRWPEIDLRSSAMIGDSLIDVEAGEAVGMRSIRLGVDVPGLSDAVDSLLLEHTDPQTG
jgi:D-glycero-D-manno-heptose 1,7-bisphosphate phosphatase